MSRRLFEEVQSYRQCRSLWYAFIVLALLMFTPILYAMYGQLILGIPTANGTTDDGDLVAVFLVIVIVYVVVMVAFLAVKMEVYVDANGIHYKSYVNKAKWVTITKDNLESYEVRKKRRTVFDPGARSFYKKYAGKMTCAILRGGLHLELTLKNQSKIFLGTQRPDEFAHAIRKMIEIDTSHHGG
jgi:hypothetical protein